MIWINIVGAALIYIIAFFVGKKYEQDNMLNNVVGVVAEIDECSNYVASMTYYYSEDLYNSKIQELKKNGVNYFE